MRKWRGVIVVLALLISFPGFGATESCKDKSCKAEKPVCKSGAEIVNVAAASDCCPRYACRNHAIPKNCEGAVCTGVTPTCGRGQVTMNKATVGACCPNWACVDKKL